MDWMRSDGDRPSASVRPYQGERLDRGGLNAASHAERRPLEKGVEHGLRTPARRQQHRTVGGDEIERSGRGTHLARHLFDQPNGPTEALRAPRRIRQWSVQPTRVPDVLQEQRKKQIAAGIAPDLPAKEIGEKRDQPLLQTSQLRERSLV